MASVNVLIGAGSIGQAIARRVSPGKQENMSYWQIFVRNDLSLRQDICESQAHFASAYNRRNFSPLVGSIVLSFVTV
jgi:hypothetical protein